MRHKFSYNYYEFISVITIPELNYNNIQQRCKFTLEDLRKHDSTRVGSFAYAQMLDVYTRIYIHAYVVLTV